MAAITSAALHKAACLREDNDFADVVILLDHNFEAVVLLLNCWPSSWFESTEKLIMDLLKVYNVLLDANEAVAYITLLFNKLSNRIILTEDVLLKTALLPCGNRVL